MDIDDENNMYFKTLVPSKYLTGPILKESDFKTAETKTKTDHCEDCGVRKFVSVFSLF